MSMIRILSRAALAASLLALPLFSGPAHAQMVNAQTGTTYTVLNTDCDPAGAKLLSFNNAAAVAVTLPQAGASGAFLAGCRIHVQNQGLGAVTVTPTTSVINSGTPLILNTGQSADIYSDATPAAVGNYWALMGGASTGVEPLLSRNLVDNGAMQVQQRGTGIRTCAQNAGITSAAYSADRWACQANVGSGAGRMAAVTTGGPTGILNAQTIYRTSGALTQPVCAMQEIPTSVVSGVAGQPVTLSFYAYALAGLSADNGNVINAYIMTGTTADQGLANSPTASPAVTPAWAGILATTTKAYTITTTPTRYTLTGTLPANTLEVNVAFCFTPTATGAGVTDGFGFTGVQLEQGTLATPFEFHTVAYDTLIAQSYYWEWDETVSATTDSPFMCQAQSTTVAICKAPSKVSFRAAPTITCTPGTVKRQVAGTDTTVSACAAAATTNGVSDKNEVTITATVASGDTAGFASSLMSGNSTGGGIITASSDF